ncbi:sugar ABC transporter permease, partial [Campylobacter lari]
VQTVLAAVSIPEGWRFTGLYMLIIYAALMAVPRDLEEAARLDGASWWQIFWRIRFPYIRPVWITTTVMATTFALRGFDIPYLLTNGGPGQSSELLTTYMYKTAFVHTDYGTPARSPCSSSSSVSSPSASSSCCSDGRTSHDRHPPRPADRTRRAPGS